MLDKEELITELKEKVIEAMGSESTAASVFEDPEFINKLGEILYWLVGKIILEVGLKVEPKRKYPPGTGEPWTVAPSVIPGKWTKTWKKGLRVGVSK